MAAVAVLEPRVQGGEGGNRKCLEREKKITRSFPAPSLFQISGRCCSFIKTRGEEWEEGEHPRGAKTKDLWEERGRKKRAKR